MQPKFVLSVFFLLEIKDQQHSTVRIGKKENCPQGSLQFMTTSYSIYTVKPDLHQKI